MSTREFITAIVDHPLLGWIILPYQIIKRQGHGYFAIDAQISPLNADRYLAEMPIAQQEIVKLCNAYSEQALFAVFAKKKDRTAVDFMKKMKPDFARQFIRPYIEKRMKSITDILVENDIPLYFRGKHKYINKDEKIELKPGFVIPAVHINKQEKGTYYSIELNHEKSLLKIMDQPVEVLVQEPARIIINNELFYFRELSSKKLKPFFMKDVLFIPESAEAQWYKTFATEAIKKFPVRASGIQIKDGTGTPHPRLQLKPNLRGSYEFFLIFDYQNNLKVEAFKGDPVLVNMQKTENSYRFIKTKRQKELEEKTIRFLHNAGLTEQKDLSLSAGNADEDNTYKNIDWLVKHAGRLKDQGIDIEQQTEKSFAIAAPQINTRITENLDWFDLYIDVEIGAFNIPFTRFKKHILQKKREFTLPDGNIFLIPEEWFSRFTDILTFGYKDGNNLKMNKFHFQFLDNQELSGENSKIEKYKELLKAKELDYELPQGIKADLRSYQKKGYDWMRALHDYQFGGCLADDMGLGKTLQTLSLMKSLSQVKVQQKISSSKEQLSLFDAGTEGNKTTPPTSLIVVPTSLVHNWEAEINKFAPDLRYLKHTGMQRTKDPKIFADFDLVITSYGIVRNDLDMLQRFGFYYLILDESQYIKNPGSKIYKAITSLNSEYRLVLTGTPIENSLTDLWAQINFLNPGLLGNLSFFKKEFVNRIEKNKDEQQKEKLQMLIQPFIMRRTKDQVAKDLPEKTEQLVYCEMTDEQKSFYEEEKSKIRNKLLTAAEEQEDKPTMLAIEGLTRLRQIANHPKLVDPGLTYESGKLTEIIRHMESIRAENHKVLIFSAYIKHLNLLAEHLENQQQDYLMLTGKTRKREEVIWNFQEATTPKVMLIQIKAGGVGLNLTAADYVFIIDPWWNPAVEEQAINRTHRIGQDKKVFIYRFITAESIEEKIKSLQARKFKLADDLIHPDRLIQKFSFDKIMELLS